MRRCYLVSYDVRDPKRLRQVFKALKGYGEHWQYSLFFCVLKDIDRVRLQGELEEVLNLKEDQMMIFDLGPDEEVARNAVTTLGQSMPAPDAGTIVI